MIMPRLKGAACTWLQVSYFADLSFCCRFKLMNWEGCSADMKARAEEYLQADWAPKAPETVVGPAVAPVVKKRKREQTSGFTAFMSLVDSQLAGAESESESEHEPQQPLLPSAEVQKYLAMPQLPFQRHGRDTNPLEWWKMHEHELPHLAKMARQFLAMPASSAGPERLFSAAGKMHDGLKKNTKAQTLGMMLEVKMDRGEHLALLPIALPAAY